MYTSALALHEALEQVKRLGPKMTFAHALVEIFEIPGDDAAGDALVQIRKLALQVQRDIDELSLTQESKSLLEKSYAPFQPLSRFGYNFHTLDQLQQNILRSENLASLLMISLALDGKINRIEDRVGLTEIETEIAEILEKLPQSGLPERTQKILFDRLEQIRTTVTHYRFWGTDGLDASLERITGALAIHLGPTETKKKPPVIAKVLNTVARLARFSKNAKDITENVTTIGTHFGTGTSAPEGIEAASKLAGA